MYVSLSWWTRPLPPFPHTQKFSSSNKPGCVSNLDSNRSILAVCTGPSYAYAVFPNLNCSGSPVYGPVTGASPACFNSTPSPFTPAGYTSSVSVVCPAVSAAVYSGSSCQGTPTGNIIPGLCLPYNLTNAAGGVASGVVTAVCTGSSVGQLQYYAGSACSGAPVTTVNVSGNCSSVTVSIGTSVFSAGAVTISCPATFVPNPSANATPSPTATAPVASSPSPSPYPFSSPSPLPVASSGGGDCAAAIPALFAFTYPNGTVVPVTSQCDPSNPADANAKQGCTVISTLNNKNYFLFRPFTVQAAAGTFNANPGCPGV